MTQQIYRNSGTYRIVQSAVCLALVMVAGSAAAEPLTATILRESGRLAREVEGWNEQCGSKPLYDEVCTAKRRSVSAQLAEFVVMVNDEIDSLRHPAADTLPPILEQFAGRRRIMELETRVALHEIKCLGLTDSQCSDEAADIKAERSALADRYREAHDFFDHGWFSLSVAPGSIRKVKPGR